MSELMWVPCPAGPITGDQATLSVLVVPRLSEPLSQAGMADWPAKLATLGSTITVDVRRGGHVAQVQATLRSQADSQVWKGFFTGITVTPYQDPAEYRVPAVEETGKFAGRIASTYKTSAREIADVGAPAADGTVRAQLQPWLEAHHPVALGPDAAYRPPDFHRAVSVLREHPSVMRALGLVFDLTITTSALPQARPPDGSAAANAFIRVRCTNAGIPVVSPWTGYEFDGQRFLPASTGEIRSGMVDLKAATDDAGSQRWEIATVDIDNGSARLRDAARAVLQGGEPGTTASLPALRSAGLMLLRRDRAEAFANRTRATRARMSLRDKGEVELTADDLVLGYRIDVQPHGSSRWFSLCERRATYHVGTRQIGAADLAEEGQVKPHAARGDGAGNLLPLDEVVAKWTGWGLALPPPLSTAQPARTPAAATLPFVFKFDHKCVPKSLPRLRFGNAYWMRVRVADMAGNGLRKDVTDAQYAIGPVNYTRWEPIPPPEVPAPAGSLTPHGEPIPGALGPGGTVDQLVVRSDPAAEPAVTGPPYPPNASRDILPAPTTRQLAEQHRVFDTADADRRRELFRRSMSRKPAQAVTGDVTAAYSWLPDPAAAGVAIHVQAAPGGVSAPLTLVRDWFGDWPDHLPKKLELTAGPLGSQADIGWWDQDQKLAVQLAPAQQVTLELSSSPQTQMLDNFSIWQWMNGRPDMITAGRHPMMTPPRLINLVHAVRRPLGTPAGPLTPNRTQAETFTRLLPTSGDALLGIDPNSTVQLDVAASWDEPVDNETRPVSGAVQVVPVTLGATSLPELRHEFGDTKHRQVTYELKAISRFRRFFADNEPELAFQAATEVQVAVPSSAQPAPPVVIRTAPAFRWEGATPANWTRLEHTRQGGHVRVELARPWYDSGAGEQIAVLVWPGTSTPPPPEARPLVTWLSRDPIFATPYPAGNAAGFMFTGVTSRRVRLPDSTVEVDAIPYNVTFSGDTWYADIAIPQPVTTSYCPFVRLALARFQLNSLPGLELSSVVQAEPVPLLPTRKLIAERSSAGITVKLTGLGPEASANKVKVMLERCQRPAGIAVSAVSLTAVDANELNAPAWVRVSTTQGNLNAAIGPIAVPAGAGFRLVVRETEALQQTGSSTGDFPDLAERTVFADVIPVS